MDMVTMNIIESAMVAICREMGVNVQKTAYSTIFSEAEDFTCALASPEGEMIAVAEYCPAQIGGVPLLVRSMVKEISLSNIKPGDVIVHNDPYREDCTLQNILCLNLYSLIVSLWGLL